METNEAPARVKPKCTMIGTNGNVFALASRVSVVLKEAGLRVQVAEFRERLWKCKSYDETLALMMEYVEIE